MGTIRFGEGVRVDRAKKTGQYYVADDRDGHYIMMNIPVVNDGFTGSYHITSKVTDLATNTVVNEERLWLDSPVSTVPGDPVNNFLHVFERDTADSSGSKLYYSVYKIEVWLIDADGMHIVDTWTSKLSFIPPLVVPNEYGDGLGIGMYPTSGKRNAVEIATEKTLEVHGGLDLSSQAQQYLRDIFFPLGSIILTTPYEHYDRVAAMGGSWDIIGHLLVTLDNTGGESYLYVVQRIA